MHEKSQIKSILGILLVLVMLLQIGSVISIYSFDLGEGITPSKVQIEEDTKECFTKDTEVGINIEGKDFESFQIELPELLFFMSEVDLELNTPPPQA